MKPIIRVENLSKQYRIGAQQASYATFRDSFSNAITAPFRHLKKLTTSTDHRPPTTDHPETIWALKDINFEVIPGEVVGIIGRNGAGKSTLLKILSRITEPTTGKIDLHGRVSSLLEVGTGFHPELTGRENIYLNGAVLGMKRAEIARKFDEIVAFAEIEKFLDTPVKHYSSGMYMRLAFSVAAHLEPEILIVDEVLAVGDVEFQKKCLGKMQEVAEKQGRTVLFVSHNLAAIKSLCSKALVLRQGHITFNGEADTAIESQTGNIPQCVKAIFEPQKDRPCITGIEVIEEPLERGDLIISIQFESPFPLNPPVPGIVLSSLSGTPVFGSNARFHNQGYGRPSLDKGEVCLIAKDVPLINGRYKLSVWLGDWFTDYDHKPDVVSFNFRKGNDVAFRPSSEINSYLNWPGVWVVPSPEEIKRQEL